MSAMPTKKIGDDDVAEMGLSLMGLSAFYGQVESDEERFKVCIISSLQWKQLGGSWLSSS